MKEILTGVPVGQAVSHDALADPDSLAPFLSMRHTGDGARPVGEPVHWKGFSARQRVWAAGTTRSTRYRVAAAPTQLPGS